MPANGIEITKVEGGKPEDQDNLKGCYFLSTDNPGWYQFYDKHCDLISTNPSSVTTGTNFTFSKHKTDWSVTELVFDPTAIIATSANANWRNGRQLANDDGTFHAEASGGKDESAASAKA